ncbi:MAG: deoxyribodipyrimidine photolyase-related protein [Akkermansiaceae bacterium]|jgi:deoxyribodipyrimidine photolyase-related protein
MPRSLALVFPHQLFPSHPALADGCPVLLVEDPLFFGTDPEQPLAFHAKKLILHRASMKRWADGRENLTYLELPESPTRTDLLLEDHVPKDVETLVYVDTVDFLIERRLERFASKRGLELRKLPSPMFLTPDDWMTDLMDGMKKPFMKTFYEAQRKRLNLLLEADGSPLGGKWSYDAENRKKLPKKEPVPEPYSPGCHDEVKAAREWVAERFPDAPGSRENFTFPSSRREALCAMSLFFEERFELFGDFEDAISTRVRVMFHSVLTPPLNIGLITPEEIVEAAMDAAEKNAKIPLNSLEGFIRQIIGWREFMRIIYLRHGVMERKENFWKFTREMPAAFYDGTTGIAPVDHTIHALLEDGYTHHIERLMVLGNFMLLCRIHPDAVYRWFMELFIDAYDWVMVPNVYGMSQFADGGVFSTKPYISGSNYIRKMSDFPKGDWCEVWDGLYWTFIEDHRDFFAAQYRLAMMPRLLDKMADEKRAGHRKKADEFIARHFVK